MLSFSTLLAFCRLEVLTTSVPHYGSSATCNFVYCIGKFPHVQLHELCFCSSTQAQPALVLCGNYVHTPMLMKPVSDISVTLKLFLNIFAFRHACKIPEHSFGPFLKFEHYSDQLDVLHTRASNDGCPLLLSLNITLTSHMCSTMGSRQYTLIMSLPLCKVAVIDTLLSLIML